MDGMLLTHAELDDLIMAVECWLEEYNGASSQEEWERVRDLRTRLKVRRLTTRDIKHG